MRTYLHALLVLAASVLASTAHAQLQTFDTRPNYSGSTITFNAGATMGQVFTNVSSVKSMTYNFFAGSGGANSPTSITATFGQWTGSAFVGGTTVSLGTIIVPPMPVSWSSDLTNNSDPASFPNYEFTFDLSAISSGLIDPTYGYLTNSSNSYALMLQNNSGATGLALGLTNTNAFSYGYAHPSGFFDSNDWTFSQLVITPGNVQLTPVPESSTVAALAGATFLTGLVIKRRRQKSAAAPLAAA